MAEVVRPADPRDQLLEAFRDYLTRERGLAPGTVVNYVHVARVFTAQLADPLDGSLQNLSAEQVLGIFCGQGRHGATDQRGGPSAQSMACPLRSLLRFLFASGRVPRQLASVVAHAGRWKPASIPVRLEAAAVTALLDGCDRSTEIGRRNYAIVLLLARSGLRAGEAVGLTLDDVDWRDGTITIQGKGGRRDRLPLAWDVGEALADYLRALPSGSTCRALFLTVRPPRHALSRQGVGDLVRRGCSAAGLGEAGPHRLRHALASDLLAAGASLGEVGQVLRHRSPQTTAIYAKVDQAALAGLARPWPQAEPGTRS